MNTRRLVLLLTAAAMVTVTAAAGIWRLGQPDPVVLSSGPAASAAPSPPTVSGSGPAAGAAVREASGVLAAWDAARAQAWATGDVAGLRALYLAGSSVARQDVGRLRQYLARGLVVFDLTTEVMDLDVESRAPGRWVLRVTDRVIGATAVGDGVELALPSDRPTSRRLVLRRVAGQWRMARVTDLSRDR